MSAEALVLAGEKYGIDVKIETQGTAGIENNLTEEDIKQKLHDRIAKYMIPEKILFLEKIPKTPGLKTDKRAIRALFFPE